MSTKKIEGVLMEERMRNPSTTTPYTLHTNGSDWPGDSPATLVIHSGEPEPVYTQSEVVAMLREVQKLVSEGGQIVIAHDNPQAEQRWQKALRKVRSTLKNHGIEVL